ncbi:MAG: hypothetical protein ACK5NT_06560 [Pyrinomonadaceae bacterium]
MKSKILKRTFQVWKYEVSHQKLLIRSPSSPNLETNIDIVFYGVKFMELKDIFHGIEFLAVTPDELTSVNQLFLSEQSKTKLYKFRSEGREFRVVALTRKIYRNNLDWLDDGFDSEVLLESPELEFS